MGKFKPGDTAFIIESGRFIRDATVIRVSRDMYTIKFTDTGGGMGLREGRLYPSREAAEEAEKRAEKPLPIIEKKCYLLQKVA